MASTEKRNHCVIIASGWLKSNFKKPSKRQQHYSEYLLVNGLFTWKIETTCIRRKNYLKKKLAKRGIGFYKLSISIIVPAFPPPFLALQPWFPAFPPWFLDPTLIPRIPIIPLFPLPDSPFRLLQIAYRYYMITSHRRLIISSYLKVIPSFP